MSYDGSLDQRFLRYFSPRLPLCEEIIEVPQAINVIQNISSHALTAVAMKHDVL
jgi:hypothetical protein